MSTRRPLRCSRKSSRPQSAWRRYPFWATRALNTVGSIHGELEDPLGAMDWNRRGIAAASKLISPIPRWRTTRASTSPDNLMALGRLDEAEEQLQRVEAVVRDPTPAQRLDLWRYSQHLFHTYGALWLVRGDTAKTLSFTERCLELAEPGEAPGYVSKARCLRAQVFLRERQARGIRGRAQDRPRERPPARQPASAVEDARRPRRP